MRSKTARLSVAFNVESNFLFVISKGVLGLDKSRVSSLILLQLFVKKRRRLRRSSIAGKISKAPLGSCCLFSWFIRGTAASCVFMLFASTRRLNFISSSLIQEVLLVQFFRTILLFSSTIPRLSRTP